MKTQETYTWSNWSGLQQAHPQHILHPDNVLELQHIVQSHPKIRVVGAGHSFTPLVCTDATLVSLNQISGVSSSDTAHSRCSLYAGTRLYNLDQYLEPINQALMNQGDIDQQSLAGAVSTGTHGTGADLHCISAYVKDFELLTASGEILNCSRTENPEIFAAGRVSLGSLGILTKITMQNRPHFKLKEHIQLCTVADMMQFIQQWKHQHRHIECFVFSHAEKLMLKTLDETDEEPQPRKESYPSEDMLLTICSELIKNVPSLNPYVQKLLGTFVKPTMAVDWSSKIFPTVRNTKFNEMEYQIPVDDGLDCLRRGISGIATP